jgi:hypothetical protein
MIRYTILSIVALCFVSCADEEPKKQVGPVSNSSQLPWNMPQKGQGGGAFSAMPQNQHRR